MARGAASTKAVTKPLPTQRDAPSLRTTTDERKLDADPHLPIALGAAYEVLARHSQKKAARASGQPAALGSGALWKHIHSSAPPEEPQPAGSGRQPAPHCK